jgi:YVTN family beta-propeller protein
MSSGSLALSSDDSLLYAVDTDSGTVSVVSTKDHAKLAQVRVGRLPDRIVVGPDDTLYVANRGDRSVSIIRRGEWVEAGRIAVGVEPSGLAVSPDNRTLYVVNATTLTDARVGSLQAVDLASRATLWEAKVGREPRGLALLPDGRAAVGLSRNGEVALVDLKTQRVLGREGKSLFEKANASVLQRGMTSSGAQATPGAPSTFQARGMTDVVASPDGEQLFATATWMSDAVLGGDTSQAGSGASYGSSNPCSSGGGVATAGVVTFEGATGEPRADDMTSCFNSGDSQRDYPATVISTPTGTQPVQGPTVGVVDPTGGWFFVVNKESSNVAVLPTSRAGLSAAGGASPGLHSVVAVGAGPDGIALTRDGRTAYVYSQFDHTLSKLEGANGLVRNVAEVKLAEDVLTPDQVAGRKLFFSAVDSRMTSPGVNVSCASCHPDGAREDGHVWNFTEGPRQTPSLAGRNLTQTAPFHWNGEFPALQDFMFHTISGRMGGSSVTATMERQLAAFIESAPPADNPHRGESLTAQQRRGAEVFDAAGCGGCHMATNSFTDGLSHDVGTFVLKGAVRDDVLGKLAGGLNTPSLLSLARTGPFLHDGSAPDFKSRILQDNDDMHGYTSGLSDAQVDDLVAYLNAL